MATFFVKISMQFLTFSHKQVVVRFQKQFDLDFSDFLGFVLATFFKKLGIFQSSGHTGSKTRIANNKQPGAVKGPMCGQLAVINCFKVLLTRLDFFTTDKLGCWSHFYRSLIFASEATGTNAVAY